ncbi:MAG: radical SAM protein [Deltaproteobacteria bacterium]|nr:radical SAM protein [Deltaproteobacteria bacterium]
MKTKKKDLKKVIPLNQIYGDSLEVSQFLAQTDPLAILASELGQGFKDYRIAWEKAKNFSQIPPFPLHVDYELKRACNLKCPVCPNADSPSIKAVQPKRELEPTTVKNLIDQGLKSSQASMGFGGLWEPLLSPNLVDLIAYGRQNGLIEAMFNTNGLLLSPNLSRDLIEAGLTRIMISLDAVTEKTYAQMRPGSDFRLVKNNIYELLDIKQKLRLKLPLIRLSFCLTKHNQRELPQFLATWQGLVDFFSIQRYGLLRRGGPDLFANLPLSPAAPRRCAQPFKRLSVGHDGLVYPCCDLSGLNLPLGSIYEQDLLTLWNEKSLSLIRAEHSRLPLSLNSTCLSCQNKYQPSP